MRRVVDPRDILVTFRPEVKVCPKCRRELSATAFYVRREKRDCADGLSHVYETLSAYCKECAPVLQRGYRLTPQRRRELRAAAYERDRVLTFMQERVSAYRKKSRELGIPSDLTVPFLVSLWEQQEGNCYYSGQPMTIFSGQGKGKMQRDSASLDRKTPSLGYIQTNVVWCSFWLNSMKRDFTELEFYEMCRRVLSTNESRSHCILEELGSREVFDASSELSQEELHESIS